MSCNQYKWICHLYLDVMHEAISTRSGAPDRVLSAGMICDSSMDKKSDTQWVLLETLFTFGQIQTSGSNGK